MSLLLKELPRLVKTCTEPLKAQNVGNMLYGLQGMKSDCPEVRALLRELPRLVKTCTEQFTAQEISNMLYGLQRLHLDVPEVSALIDALLPHINSSIGGIASPTCQQCSLRHIGIVR